MSSHDDCTEPPSGTTDDDQPALRVEPTATGLRVAGELDLATASVLSSHLLPLPTWSDDVVIDLDELRFVDSTGLTVLLRAHQQAVAEGRRLVLASPSPRVRRLLEITALETVLFVADDADTAGDDSAGVSA